MYYFINQIKKKDCAFASLKILLANVYKKKDFLYVIQDKDDKSYSLKEIINEAKKYGVVLKGYKLEEISEMTGLKTSNLYNKLSRIRKKLRKSM